MNDRRFIYRQDGDLHILELIFRNSQTNRIEVTNVPYASERFHFILSHFEKLANQETMENRNNVIKYIIASKCFLREKDDYYSPTVERILKFFLKIDKNLFGEFSEENLYQYARRFLLCLVVANDLIESKHKIHILLFKVIAKYSIISEGSFDSFVENDIYHSISCIIGLYIDYIKDNNQGQDDIRYLFETLNYSLYILYKFSSNTKIYLKDFDTIKMIDRAKHILTAYLNRENYLKCPQITFTSPNFTPSIILCSLLCYFNNLITKISKKDFSSILDDKFILSLVNLTYEFVINKIDPSANYTIVDYQIDYGAQQINNYEYIKYFDVSEVLKPINRFLKILEILKFEEENSISRVNELRRSLDSIINHNGVGKVLYYDTLLIQSQLVNLQIGDGDGESVAFENRFRENNLSDLNGDEIVEYLDIVKDESKTNEGLDRLERNIEFLKLFLEKIIRGLNKNFVNLQVLYKKNTIEQIILIISKTLSNEVLSNALTDLWFVFLLKIILRQTLYSGRRYPIDKTSFELFFSVLSMHRTDRNVNLFDFCQENTEIDNFIFYYAELTSNRLLKYNNVQFLRDLCLYLIIMIAGNIHIIFDTREAFFNITHYYLESIFQMYCEPSEDDLENIGVLTLYEVFSYISLVVPTFLEKYCTRNQFIEGEAIHIFDWLKILYRHASCINENSLPSNKILTYKFIIRAVIKCIDEIIRKNFVLWRRIDFYNDIMNSLNNLPIGNDLLIQFEGSDFI
jgi:hypothetical protein